MRKLLITICAGAGLAVLGGAALAQSYNNNWTDTSRREADMGGRIREAVNHGDLSYAQASQLRSELGQIVQLDNRYRDEGMTGWDARDLNSRLALLGSRFDYDVSMNRGDNSGYYSSGYSDRGHYNGNDRDDYNRRGGGNAYTCGNPDSNSGQCSQNSEGYYNSRGAYYGPDQGPVEPGGVHEDNGYSGR
jgi:hypothetical protein